MVLLEEWVAIEDAKAGIMAIKAANMKAIGGGTYEQMEGADIILNGTGGVVLI